MYLIISNEGKVIFRTDILSLASKNWLEYESNKEKYKGYKFVQLIEENFDEQNVGTLLTL